MMKTASILISSADLDRLSHLIGAFKQSRFRNQHELELLNESLETAEIISRENFPKDVIRMNSFVRVLDLRTRKKESYTLVYPEDADISAGRISVLAPVGIALLGHKQGDVTEVRVPTGTRRLRVERVLYRGQGTGKRVQQQQSESPKFSLSQKVQRIELVA